MITLLATVFVFGMIVLIHELGHFITAKWSGMRVDEFAIGFGPKLIGIQKGETLYSIRLIPLGGFNRIAGMSPEEELDDRSFLNKPVWKRFIVIAAGATFNFLLAIVLFFIVFAGVGTQKISTEATIGHIAPGSPAAMAHLELHDKITLINGQPVTQWADIGDRLQGTAHHAIDITVERDGQSVTTTVIPNDDKGRAIIGINPETYYESMSIGQAAQMAVLQTGAVIYGMVDGLVQMIAHAQGENLSGPVGVAQMAGQVASVGFVPLLMFTALLSINLGVINLFPLPVLDGGHLVLLLIEGITGKKLPPKALQYVQLAGVALLLLLFLYATTQDVTRLIHSLF
ncbi:MAG: RIP metalloprotease RseP [Veillonella sp.]|nr:RIP metalloprotease RseP [Veillonella sp.]MCF0155832.1 RIP metalloprotease RseP [Veillonella sp.]